MSSQTVSQNKSSLLYIVFLGYSFEVTGNLMTRWALWERYWQKDLGPSSYCHGLAVRWPALLRHHPTAPPGPRAVVRLIMDWILYNSLLTFWTEGTGFYSNRTDGQTHRSPMLPHLSFPPLVPVRGRAGMPKMQVLQGWGREQCFLQWGRLW